MRKKGNKKPICYFCNGDSKHHEKVFQPENVDRTGSFPVVRSTGQQRPLKNFSNTHLATPRLGRDENPEL